MGSTRRPTNLDISASVEEYIIGFDVAMNDVLAVEMSKPFAGLQIGQQASKRYCSGNWHTSLQIVDI